MRSTCMESISARFSCTTDIVVVSFPVTLYAAQYLETGFAFFSLRSWLHVFDRCHVWWWLLAIFRDNLYDRIIAEVTNSVPLYQVLEQVFLASVMRSVESKRITIYVHVLSLPSPFVKVQHVHAVQRTYHWPYV